jgi:hypothetical protein
METGCECRLIRPVNDGEAMMCIAASGSGNTGRVEGHVGAR